MKPLISVNLPPVWNMLVEILIDRGFGRATNLIAKLLVFRTQFLQFGSERMLRSPLRQVEHLRTEVLLVLPSQIRRHFCLLLMPACTGAPARQSLLSERRRAWSWRCDQEGPCRQPDA